MANYECCKVVSLPAGEDLAGDFTAALTIDSDGRVVKTTSATDVIVGALASEPATTDTGAAVAVAIIGGGGVLKMRAGADIDAGELIVPSATAGRVESVDDIAGLAADQMAVGIALSGAADGDVFEVLAMTIAGPTA